MSLSRHLCRIPALRRISRYYPIARTLKGHKAAVTDTHIVGMAKTGLIHVERRIDTV